jgi:hypothetical protein
MSVYQWINKEKSRYFTIIVKKEAQSEIVLKHSWGGIHSNRGGKKDLLVHSEDEMQRCITNMMKRRKSRGYEIVSP